MPAIFQKLDKIRPVYDVVDKIVMVICKLLLIADILITTYQVLGRYVPFIKDPAWTEETILTLMSYMAVLVLEASLSEGSKVLNQEPVKAVKRIDLGVGSDHHRSVRCCRWRIYRDRVRSDRSYLLSDRLCIHL